uniref:Glutaredoxin domain-containing protein n=1 Tax=Biomphalaria glabrata TaxID=6526 RepID=A0A2C9K0D9_BIOGL
MGDVKSLVDSKIAGKKVMIFSKQSCPYCTKAKNTFSKYLGNALSESDYEVLEIDELSNCSAIQDYLQKLTGARSSNVTDETSVSVPVEESHRHVSTGCVVEVLAHNTLAYPAVAL